MLISGTLFISSERAGLLVAICFLIQAATIDNPILSKEGTTSREFAFQNMYKDFIVIIAALMINAKNKKVVHREDIRR